VHFCWASNQRVSGKHTDCVVDQIQRGGGSFFGFGSQEFRNALQVG